MQPSPASRPPRKGRPTSIAALLGLLALAGAVLMLAPTAATAVDDQGENACQQGLPNWIVNEEGVCELHLGGEEVIVVHDPPAPPQPEPEPEPEVHVCELDPQVCVRDDRDDGPAPGSDGGGIGGPAGGGSVKRPPTKMERAERAGEIRRCERIKRKLNGVRLDFDHPKPGSILDWSRAALIKGWGMMSQREYYEDFLRQWKDNNCDTLVGPLKPRVTRDPS